VSPITGRGTTCASGAISVGSGTVGATEGSVLPEVSSTPLSPALPRSGMAGSFGSVGSVTGSVGSVTGAVGSVTGAVGSVTGAVGSVLGSVGAATESVGPVAVAGSSIVAWSGGGSA
jgi:hypothetical protein